MKALLAYLFTQARKATVAFGGTAFATVVAQLPQALSDGQLSQPEAEQIIGSAIFLGIVAAYAVWRVPNKPAA